MTNSETKVLLEVDKLNGLLKDLDAIRDNKPIFKSEPQGGAKYFEVYDMGLGNGAFVKLTIFDDGDFEWIMGVEFIPMKQKTVVVYDFE